MARSVPSQQWRPDVPTPTPLGYTWVPPQADAVGLQELTPMAQGVIRVRKTCRRCRRGFDGWMFVWSFERKFRDCTDYDVGEYGECNPCLDEREHAHKQREYEAVLAKARRDVLEAKTAAVKVRHAERCIGTLQLLLEVVQHGSPRWVSYKADHDKYVAWVEKNHVPF